MSRIPADVVELYLKDREDNGLSPQTIRAYRDIVKRFYKEFDSVKDRPSLTIYLSRFPNERTRSHHFRGIKTFLRWGSGRKYWTDWISGLKFRFSEAAQYPTLTVEEFEKIVSVIPVDVFPERNNFGRRDVAFYSLCFYTGCRRDAVRLLRKGDVNLRERVIKVLTKGKKEAFIPVPHIAIERLKEWMRICPSEEWVFCSTRRPKKAIQDHHMSRRLHVYAEAAGIAKRVWVHGLRHSFATVLAMHNVPVDLIQGALLHSDLKVTSRYVSKLVSSQRLKTTYDTVFGGELQPVPTPKPQLLPAPRLSSDDVCDYL